MIKEIFDQLNEDSQLYSGIFWITDVDDIGSTDLYFQIPVDSYGNVEGDTFVLNAKSGTTFNHEKTWENLPSRLTRNKEYNYYPRGRVMIANGKATIWCNPNICTEELKNWCIRAFHLIRHNGIKRIDVKPDYSEHYQCYLDW